MAVRAEFANGKEEIQSPDNIVDLGKRSVFAVDHGIGSGALFGEVHHGIRLKFSDRSSEKIVIADIADKLLNGFAGELLPYTKAVGKWPDRGDVCAPSSVIPLAAEKIIISMTNGLASTNTERWPTRNIHLHPERPSSFFPLEAILEIQVTGAENDRPNSAWTPN